ncbi:hypothetical protein LZ32DRAFT_644442 [Colletotrichum eremochloae]|nr:hypothetical protein LZ32DRAFT_644442 [Colletotrichum eremochloae]
MRSLTPEPSLDTEGFAIYNVPTTMMRPDFANDTKVQDLYCREIEKYFFEALGAKHIRALDYQTSQPMLPKLSYMSCLKDLLIEFFRPDIKLSLSGDLLSSRTVDTADLIPSDVIYPTFVTENYLAHYNEQNQWYWLPDHKPNEVLVFKALDSAQPDSFHLEYPGFE